MYRWYATQSEILSKELFMHELKKNGYKEETQGISDVLFFEFKQDILNLDTDNSLLEGYVLLRIKDKSLKDVVAIIKNKRIGTFFNLDGAGLPYPIPNEEVSRFKKKVRATKDSVKVGVKLRS
jgi:hypothetical protein